MVLMQSADVPLGSELPKFKLKDAFGKEYDSDSLIGEKGLLVAIMCNHCPYAKAVWPRLIKLSKKARELGINVVAINPNINPEYPEDLPDKMREKVEEWQIDFPYLVDETQEVAKALNAQCTPDFYLFDRNKKLVYHGRFDDNWKDETKVTKRELEEAIENLANGKPISKEQHPSMGCSIKWK